MASRTRLSLLCDKILNVNSKNGHITFFSQLQRTICFHPEIAQIDNILTDVTEVCKE